MKLIPLSKGLFTKVDDSDFDYLMQWKWCATVKKYTAYAMRFERTEAGRNRISIHRLLLHAPIGVLVDHIDGDGLNNQRSNIRLATHAQNQANKRGHGISKYSGVTYEPDRNKWRVSIGSPPNRIRIRFNTEIEAAKAYNEYAKTIHGDFARLNNLNL